MTTNETRPAATGNAPGASPSTQAQQTRQDESSAGARDPVAESTRGDAAHFDFVEGDALIAHDRCVDYRSRWGVVLAR